MHHPASVQDASVSAVQEVLSWLQPVRLARAIGLLVCNRLLRQHQTLAEGGAEARQGALEQWAGGAWCMDCESRLRPTNVDL